MSIYTHTVVGTNDIVEAKKFYDALMSVLEINVLMENENRVVYGNGIPTLGVTKPINGEPATAANGGTIGFMGKSKEQVDALHAAALANGGSCEGAPGPREAIPNSYGAYFRDPLGNKFCIFTILS